MAAVTVSVQHVTPDGLAVALSAVAGVDGIKFVNDSSGRSFVDVLNGGGGSINVTVAGVQETVRVPGVGELDVPDIVVAVAAGARKSIGPFGAAYTAADGTVTAAFSGVSSVTAAAVKLDPVI